MIAPRLTPTCRRELLAELGRASSHELAARYRALRQWATATGEYAPGAFDGRVDAVLGPLASTPVSRAYAAYVVALATSVEAFGLETRDHAQAAALLGRLERGTARGNRAARAA